MKKIIIILLGSMMLLPAFSQEQELSKKELRKLEKEMKKEQQAKDAELQAEMVSLMVVYQRFVLEADQLRDKKGNTVHVDAVLNFIACDSINGVIQIGSNSYVGVNGVGGITLEGPISNYKFTKNEKTGSYNVSYNIRSTAGNYDIRMTVFSDGRADATVGSNWPSKVNYMGTLVPPVQSRVYKGTSY